MRDPRDRNPSAGPPMWARVVALHGVPSPAPRRAVPGELSPRRKCRGRRNAPPACPASGCRELSPRSARGNGPGQSHAIP